MNVVAQMLHPKTMKAADVVTEMLHSVGVRRIYGVVGDSLNGITESQIGRASCRERVCMLV